MILYSALYIYTIGLLLYHLVRLRHRQCPALMMTFGVKTDAGRSLHCLSASSVTPQSYEVNDDFAKIGNKIDNKCKKNQKNQEYENFRILILCP